MNEIPSRANTWTQSVATYEMEKIVTADIIFENQTSKYKYQTKNPKKKTKQKFRKAKEGK